ncbi:hypothetical protein SAMN05444380_107111 [Thermophagus xiamenensis]|uniref:Uncharacterized protein n=1 Tax=Thermophagus xiamenensis TaxID=385682 RepID=A0A1I1Y866_9BACT|nr:hypothetical protein SAMN05444380_107111 [Thermophagus xiamenensis]
MEIIDGKDFNLWLVEEIVVFIWFGMVIPVKTVR